MAKRNHVARICARLTSGSNMAAADIIIRPEKYKVLTAVERVMAIRAKKNAELRRQFFTEDKTEVRESAAKFSNPIPHSAGVNAKTPALILPRTFFKVATPFKKGKKKELFMEDVVSRGHSNFCFEPMRPRLHHREIRLEEKERIDKIDRRRHEYLKSLRTREMDSIRTLRRAVFVESIHGDGIMECIPIPA